jgi:hydroxypyruvate reductase
MARQKQYPDRRLCLLAGGETTVTIRGNGKGGRNQELALAAAIELAGTEGLLLLSAGSDGNDGPTEAAGAWAGGRTIQRAEELMISAQEYLNRNDSYTFFQTLEDLIITGPTRTNVMDIVIMLAG